MPRQYVLSAGVRSDFDNVLAKLKEKGSVRFTDFSSIWRDLGMSMIFAGRQSDKELRQFTEECLSLTCRMWIDSEGFQDRVCGLYLLYALYMTQLDDPKSKIRVTMEDWTSGLKFLAEVHEQQHLDVEYVFTALRFHKAFQFVATTTPISIEMFLHGGSFSEGETKEDIPSPAKHQPSAIAEILQLDSIEQLSIIHEKYNELKCAMTGRDATEPSPSLNLIHSNFVQYITKSVTAHEDWKKRKFGKKGERKRKESGATTSESEVDSDVEMWLPPKKRQKKVTLSMAQKRKQLREQAFHQNPAISRSRRHRQVKSSDTDSSPPSPAKRLIKSRQKVDVDTSIEEEPEAQTNSPKHPDEEEKFLDMPLLIVEEPIPKKRGRKGRGKGSPKGQMVSSQHCSSSSGQYETDTSSPRKQRSPRKQGSPASHKSKAQSKRGKLKRTT